MKYRCAMGSTSPVRRSAVRHRRGPRRFPDRPRHPVWSLSTMRPWRCRRGCSHTAPCLLRSAQLVGKPSSIAAWLTKVTEDSVRALPKAPNMGRYAPAAASGSRRWDRPWARRRCMPPSSTMSGLTPKKAGSTAPDRRACRPRWSRCAWIAVRDGRVDRVLGDVARTRRLSLSPVSSGRRRAGASSCRRSARCG
jgi:hypothetical protein